MNYKIIAPILVKRLRHFLKDHIFPYQAAFIPGRWISENTLFAQETTIIIYKKTRGKCGLMGILNCMSFSKKDLQSYPPMHLYSFLLIIN